MTNGTVEGINNKLRVIARPAYGFHSHGALLLMLYLSVVEASSWLHPTHTCLRRFGKSRASRLATASAAAGMLPTPRMADRARSLTALNVRISVGRSTACRLALTQNGRSSPRAGRRPRQISSAKPAVSLAHRSPGRPRQSPRPSESHPLATPAQKPVTSGAEYPTRPV